MLFNSIIRKILTELALMETEMVKLILPFMAIALSWDVLPSLYKRQDTSMG